MELTIHRNVYFTALLVNIDTAYIEDMSVDSVVTMWWCCGGAVVTLWRRCGGAVVTLW